MRFATAGTAGQARRPRQRRSVALADERWASRGRLGTTADADALRGTVGLATRFHGLESKLPVDDGLTGSSRSTAI